MKNKKLLALLLAVILLLTQFSMLCMVSAETTALTGRTDFEMGVAVHKGNGYDAYKRPYNVILDAAALGSSLIRIDSDTDLTDAIIAQSAKKNGMDVMFVTSLGVDVKTSHTAEEYQSVYDKFYAKATALKDYDAYIQIDNEIDNKLYKSGGLFTDGTSANKYNDVTAAAIAIYAANKAVKDANAANGSNIKTIVNFSFNHYGFLKALENIKIDAATYTASSSGTAKADYDIIGWDYYSNMYDDARYSSILSGLKSEFDKKIIICESNLTPESKNSDGTIKYAQNAAWLEGFVKACYGDTRVVGFVAYELYDQPALEGSSFNKEAHFGLLDKDGNKKDTYKTICALYGGDANAALAKNRVIIEAAPEYPDYADIEILKGTVNAEWNPVYSKTANDLYIDLTVAPIDLSETSIIEFDMYIEDYDAFVKAIEGKRINFALSSDNNKSKARARYDIANQITKSGWNHITISVKSHWNKDAEFSYSTVKWALIYFQDGGEGYNPIAGSKAAIANICAVKAEIDRVPEVPANAVFEISKAGKTKEWGDKFSCVTDRMYIDVDSLDLTVSKFIEFDIYIEDQAAFHTAFDTHALRFYMSSADNRNNNRRKYNFVDQITKDGWNHIVLNREARYSSDSTAQGAIKHVGLTCDSNTGDANALKNVSVRIANIYCTDKPARPSYATVDLCTRLRNYETGSANDLKGINNYGDFDGKQETVLANDISGCDVIEFDFYCASLTTFKQNINGKSFYFVLTTSGGGRARYQFTNQVTKNGWNHIVLNKKSYDNIGESAPNFSNVQKFYFSFWGTGSGSMVNKDNPLYATNVCGAPAEIKRNPAPISDPNIFIHAGRTYDDIEKYSQFTDKPRNLDATVDITSADYIEFDFYAGDYDRFQTIINGHPFYFVLRTKNINNSDRAVYEFTDQITKSGWNHIKLEISAAKINEKADFGKIAAYNFAFWNDSGSTAINGGKVSFAIANVCATFDGTLKVPTPEVTTDKIDFIGLGLENVKFDGEGYSQPYDFDEPIDISATRMMELDVYVLDDAVTEMSVELYDEENYAVYEFKNLTAGWNHLAIRLSDNSGDEIELVEGFSFVGAVNESIHVANLYVADYVDGDANRDGKMDLKDLVRMKKYTADIASEDGKVGNVIAMDLSGNDYEVDSTDLSAFRTNILNVK